MLDPGPAVRADHDHVVRGIVPALGDDRVPRHTKDQLRCDFLRAETLRLQLQRRELGLLVLQSWREDLVVNARARARSLQRRAGGRSAACGTVRRKPRATTARASRGVRSRRLAGAVRALPPRSARARGRTALQPWRPGCATHARQRCVRVLRHRRVAAVPSHVASAASVPAWGSLQATAARRDM